MKQQSGFTLVEIAVVLVIIGLLLGGVLKGQELITQAKIKNVANDFNGLASAVYSYQDRYRALPGDDSRAKTRWTQAAVANGDGNGQIGGNYNSSTDTDESRQFWLHLRNAGFIGGSTDSAEQPLNASGGLLGVQNGGLGLAGLVMCSANLPAKIANAIDAQFDDGDATKGSVRGMKQSGSNDNVSADAPTTTYVDNGSNLYLVCKNV
ncbi:MAG: prepilin-type N-terminal cleavage/methylation domain-containing protein [Zoogloeaceae bacterium]|nr:prepilin-type N-terminal cleavage/methylation domain-containing protein [Zoogloeaceae bacterium]